MEHNIIHENNYQFDQAPEPITLTVQQVKQLKLLPLSNSRYKSATVRKTRKPRPSKYEHIVCDICGNSYTQYNVTHHRKSKHHLFCKDLNDKWKKIINI